MPLDDGRAARQGIVHHGADGFGVELLAQRGGAHHVENEDADLLEALRGFGGCWGLGGRGIERGQPGAKAGQHGLDHEMPRAARWTSRAAIAAVSCSCSEGIGRQDTNRPSVWTALTLKAPTLPSKSSAPNFDATAPAAS